MLVKIFEKKSNLRRPIVSERGCFSYAKILSCIVLFTMIFVCKTNNIYADEYANEQNILARKIKTQTKDIIKSSYSNREKAVAIARWVATNWRNASLDPEIHVLSNSNLWLKKFTHRMGLCGTRSEFFVRMIEKAGLQARRYSIYNFGEVGAGHTAVQVFWDGKWHFFDVTYAGYFEKDGEILSFDEIVSLGNKAIHYMVVFPNLGGDMYNNDQHPSKWKRIDNTERMTRIYAGKGLAKAESRGFDGQKEPVYLEFEIVPGTVLGEIDDSHQDVFKESRQRKISEQIDQMGFTSVPFFHKILFKELSVGEKYVYTINISDRSRLADESIFSAKSSDCEITDGELFAGEGTIRFIAEQSTCQINISHNIIKPGQFVNVDKISFVKLH